MTGTAAAPADATGTLQAAVSLRAATKRYGSVVAVDRVDLDIGRRELFTLLGPSGSGKTTILQLVAGLVELTSGQVRIGGEDVSARPTHERNIGMVFQSLALFPHMSVENNIAFPLRMRRVGRQEIARRVRESLEIVRLPDIGQRRVDQLSGGQQQRVALARALVYNPALLLLDEPLGALDRKLREEMQLEIVRLHREVDVTIVNVTHDQREALILSDRVGVMRDGRLEQVGTGEDLYYRPGTTFVGAFIGNANLLSGVGFAGEDGAVRLRTGGGLVVELPEGAAPAGTRCTLFLRAEAIELSDFGGRSAMPGRAQVAAVVALRAFEGEAVYYELTVAGLDEALRVSLPGRRCSFQVGDEVIASWSLEDVEVIVDQRGQPPAGAPGHSA